jgi:hypothetical protein
MMMRMREVLPRMHMRAISSMMGKKRKFNLRL